MEQNQPSSTLLPNLAETPSEPVPKDSGNAETPSEEFGNNQETPSEPTSTFPKLKDPTPEHTATVRTAAKTLEQAGHPITERTIINWCYPTKDAAAKLDCAWDKNQKKYYIKPEGLAVVVANMPKTQPNDQPKELPKEEPPNSESKPPLPKPGEQVSEDIPNRSENKNNASETPELDEDEQAELRRLRRENFQQTKTIEGNNIVIDQVQKGMDKTVKSFTAALTDQSIQVGRLLEENKQLKNLLTDGGRAKAGVGETTATEKVQVSEEEVKQPEENQPN